MTHYEIEIKTFLGEKQNADRLRSLMYKLDPSCTLVSNNRQLNHYFKDGDIENLYEKTKHFLDENEQKKFISIIAKGTAPSVRTRQNDDEVLLVVKVAVDGGSSDNGVSRLEFEKTADATLDELDDVVLAAGFSYLSKWSREREEYSYKGANVALDRTSGYGYLAEFEKIVEDESKIGNTINEIDALIAELGLEELKQDRLERMFEYYNSNWPDYYCTNKTFVVE